MTGYTCMVGVAHSHRLLRYSCCTTASLSLVPLIPSAAVAAGVQENEASTLILLKRALVGG